MPANVTVKIDTSNLMRAHQILHEYSSTEPSQALHKTVAFVIHETKENTPVVSLSRIDTELGVETVRPNKKTVNVNVPGQSMATRIALARLHPTSKYSIMTDNRYPLPMPDFGSRRDKGALFWAYIANAAERMVKARHSSTGFFKVSWNVLLKKLADLVPDNYKGAVSTWAGQGGVPTAELGSVDPAQKGNPFAICTISNLLGMDPRYPNISQRRNDAAHAILEPILQAAIDHSAETAMAKAMRDGLLARQPKLYANGMRMTV